MSFEKEGRRRGKVWDDLSVLDDVICNNSFNRSGDKEKDFERYLTGFISSKKDKFSDVAISETDKEGTPIRQAYCFGKNHRPDMAIGGDGIVIELKYGNIDNIKQAIGQSIIYRLEYKFAVTVYILPKENKELYEDITSGAKENNIKEILKYLADELNIFTYIIPAFKIGVGIPKVYKTFNPNKN